MRNPSTNRLSFRLLRSLVALAATLFLTDALSLGVPSVIALSHHEEVQAIHDDSLSEFAAACSVLTGILATPAVNDVTISPAKGGELRLKATLEDYFDTPQIDSTRWISGYSNPSFPTVPPPQVVDGALRLDANYVRSLDRLTPGVASRFFEARAQHIIDGLPPAYGDVGFYRSQPPLLEDPSKIGAIRLFVVQTVPESERPRLMYVRSRNGTMLPSTPLFDTVVDNWGNKEAAQKAALGQYHEYRIEWEAAGTNYLIDGAQVITAATGASVPLPHPGDTTLDTYAFLYSQDPSFFAEGRSPILVDWVRAGQYAAQGSYVSCVHDGGAPVNWSRMSVRATVPAGTAATVETRTSHDGATWSNWRAASPLITGDQVLLLNNPGGRYFQYRVLFSTANLMVTPEVESVTASYFQPVAVNVRPVPAMVQPGESILFNAAVLDSNLELIENHPEPVTWSVVAGGGSIDSAGRFVAGTQRGSFVDTVEARVGTALIGRATVIIDEPPIGDAGPDYTGYEGEPVFLTASASSDPYQRALTFGWDLDGNGVFDDATGVDVSYAWPDNGQYVARVLITNTVGFTATAESTVTIVNVAPSIRGLTTTAPILQGEEVTVVVDAVDVPGDQLRYAVDWDGDGVFDSAEQDSNQFVRRIDLPGIYPVTVRVRDKDGGESLSSTSIEVRQHRVYLPLTMR